MKQIIGFATQFYTLWNYSSEQQYVTDVHGKHHPSYVREIYSYIKNISKDLDRVKEIYPNVAINEELRGITQSFESIKPLDLPVEFFWAGKYVGYKIEDVLVSDFKYCLWCVGNLNSKAVDFIKEHQIYKDYISVIKKAEQAILDAQPLLVVGDEVELMFTSNGYNCSEEGDEEVYCISSASYGQVDVSVKHTNFRKVLGMYPYIMPSINGKPQKIKNKVIKVKVLEVFNTKIVNGYLIEQYIKIA